MLFDSICNSQWFVRTSIILFLNKVRPSSGLYRHSQRGAELTTAFLLDRWTSSRSAFSFHQ